MQLRGALTLVVSCAIAASGLAACGSDAPDVPVAAAEPVTSAAAVEFEAPPGDAADVEDTFRRYNKALLARDFATACTLTSPAAAKTLVAAVKKQGGKATTCDQAFRALYAPAASSAAADGVSRSIRVTAVRMADGVGSVDWTAGGQGGAAPSSSTAQFKQFGGVWKLLPPST